MGVTLYGTLPSHPSHAVRLMLERKGVEHRIVWLLPGAWPLLVRTWGFRGGTVPALKLNGRRVQHSRAISRALDDASPEPPLFPLDPEGRRQVEEAERWGERVLQPVPRGIFRWCAGSSQAVRERIAREAGMPAPTLLAAVNKPVAWYLRRKVGANDERVRRYLAELPSQLDEVDRLIGEGVIGGRDPNAADFQIATSVRVLMTIADLAPAISGRPAAALATALMAEYPAGIDAGSLPAAWLRPLRA